MSPQRSDPHEPGRLRVLALATAVALVFGLAATAPVQAAALNMAARMQVQTRKANIHEKRALKMVRIRERRLNRAQRNKLIAREMMMERHRWASAGQFRCLERLWAHESGWNERAHNGSSGAHGIPQALPGSKMGSAGPGWQNNPRTQIRWGLRYIRYRYGSPCGAWGHFQATGWY